MDKCSLAHETEKKYSNQLNNVFRIDFLLDEQSLSEIGYIRTVLNVEVVLFQSWMTGSHMLNPGVSRPSFALADITRNSDSEMHLADVRAQLTANSRNELAVLHNVPFLFHDSRVLTSIAS